MASALRETFGRAHVSRSTVDRLREESASLRDAYDTLARTYDLRSKQWRARALWLMATGFALGLAARELARAFGWWV